MNELYTYQIEGIRQAAIGNSVGKDIQKLLIDHDCYYLLDQIPIQGSYALQLEQILKKNRLQVEQRYHDCADIFLSMNMIPYAIMKGAVLSQAIYGDIHYRRSSDIDILIERKNVEQLKAQLRSNGYVQGRVTDEGIIAYTREEILYQSLLSHQIAPFVKSRHDPICTFFCIDINTDIFWGESRQKADLTSVMQMLTTTEICGITVKKLIPEMEFLALCMHHYKHMNSIYLLVEGSYHIDLFCDIYFYIRNTQMDYVFLKELSDLYLITSYIYYCLYYTYQLFGDERLYSLVELFTCEQGQKILNFYGLTEDEWKQWTIPFPERLLDCDFTLRFYNLLSDQEKNKYNINHRFL